MTIEIARTRWLGAARVLGGWLLLGALVGCLCGGASALFLHALEIVTRFREAHERIVFALPLAGLFVGAIYARWGRSVRAGNNLVIDTLHEGGPPVPLRMAPMVLAGTVITHLFGGSAGREGTAVQMGASLADQLALRLGLAPDLRRQLLVAGIAGGFGSVFGTPIAGLIFGMEVVVIGRIEYSALAPALVASLVGDLVTRALGVVHTVYPRVAPFALGPVVVGKWLLVGVAAGCVAIAFIELTHGLKKLAERRVPSLPLRMLLGGIAVVAAWQIVGTNRYLGLGVPTIVAAFSDPSVPAYAFALKLGFTSLTLAAGFLGGEVTPLFFVGATLGAALGRLLGLPIDLAAGVGLAAVFGAAANTPLALAVMAVELLGAAVLPHVLIVTVVAYLASGHRGIYPSQRIARGKLGRALPGEMSLRDLEGPRTNDEKKTTSSAA